MTFCLSQLLIDSSASIMRSYRCCAISGDLTLPSTLITQSTMVRHFNPVEEIDHLIAEDLDHQGLFHLLRNVENTGN